MLTVTLKPDMAEQINQMANSNQATAEDFVDSILRQHVRAFRREKIRAESNAFEEQKQSLLDQYRGEYVAVHEGKVIDHDPSLRALHLRVFAKLGHTPVLLKKVTDEPDRVLVFRSPKIVRNGA
ncbi:MAG: hypothetical protein HY260_06275 [Chloroflexi bacterium]|nr:hypothetical protein [Chloroflexota bacterium]